MNPTVAAALASRMAEIQTLKATPVVLFSKLRVAVNQLPTGALGYGRDLSCITDCTARFDEVDPNSRVGLGQALIRRLITTRGSMPAASPDDAASRSYGFNLRSYLNRGVPVSELRSLEAPVAAELLKDERIASVLVTITMSNDYKSMTVSIAVVAVDPTVGQFNLVFALTSTAVFLDSIGAAR